LQERRGTGITDEKRQAEDAAAFGLLGCTHEALDTTDADPDWDYVESMLRLIIEENEPDRVFAPAPEPYDGHEQHNQIGLLARQLFPSATGYMTYTNGRERSVGVEVEYEPGWEGLKRAALQCYQSQIVLASTGHHFVRAVEDMREWYQP
jgi:LmbE family N-acetylglucosaminyl deacetylase